VIRRLDESQNLGNHPVWTAEGRPAFSAQDCPRFQPSVISQFEQYIVLPHRCLGDVGCILGQHDLAPIGFHTKATAAKLDVA
jgi:hypothetical protein